MSNRLKIAIFGAGIIFTLAIVYLAVISSALGTRPSTEDRIRFQSSLQFNTAETAFSNRRPELLQEMYKRITFSDYIEALWGGSKDRVPRKKLPDVKPDLATFLKPSDNIKVIWFGHSSLLLNISGKIILIDPVFSGSASPFSFMTQRFQNPALELSELPPIDYIVISHDHYDHLDMKTIQFFKDKNVHFVVPLGVGAHLAGWGINQHNITELDWWRNFSIGDLAFIATPAQHASGRDRIHFNESLWASWIIQNTRQRVYFSGDSGYDTHFKEIGDKYGPFDIAFIENGQYNEKWREVHLLPEETIQAFLDLKAKRLFPVHWGMFNLALHSWYEPIAKTNKAAKEKGIRLVSPKLGEIVEVDDQYENKIWWEE
jgi:L-ascorbate metabolism protein UlaG (beta-lactamase superfamily)